MLKWNNFTDCYAWFVRYSMLSNSLYFCSAAGGIYNITYILHYVYIECACFGRIYLILVFVEYYISISFGVVLSIFFVTSRMCVTAYVLFLKFIELFYQVKIKQ